MSDFQTIDAVSLEDVMGGAIPVKPIINGVAKAYKVAKPWIKRAATAINIAGTIGAGLETARETWRTLTGKDQPTPPQPQTQPQGGQP